jgi:uncharacterized protein (TIGR02611 family)
MPPAAVIRSLLVFDEQHPLFGTYKVAKRIAIGIVGGTVVAIGIVMMITPGPGIPAILGGLAILSIEFAWARIWLKKVKAKAQSLARSMNGNQNQGGPPPPAPPGS